MDFPIKNGDFPWQNVSSPDGIYTQPGTTIVFNRYPIIHMLPHVIPKHYISHIIQYVYTLIMIQYVNYPNYPISHNVVKPIINHPRYYHIWVINIMPKWPPPQQPSIRAAGAFRPAAQASPGDTQIDSAVTSASLEDESRWKPYFNPPQICPAASEPTCLPMKYINSH